MDNNIVETVYKALETRTAEISEVVAQRDEIDADIRSGRFTPQAMKDEGMYHKRDELKGKVTRDTDRAIREVQGIIDQYKSDVADANRLNPADLTDDVKLLQTGIILNDRDIKGMLERNADNKTMTQIILRYAKEHNIDTGKTYYVGGQKELAIAQALQGILFQYGKWISKPNGKEMLDKFFSTIR